jgi:hypothetical protein
MRLRQLLHLLISQPILTTTTKHTPIKLKNNIMTDPPDYFFVFHFSPMEGAAATFFISKKVRFSDIYQKPSKSPPKAPLPDPYTHKTLYQNLVLTKAPSAYKMILSKMGEATKKQGD